MLLALGVVVGCLALARLVDYLGRDHEPHVSEAWLRAHIRDRREGL